LLQIYGGYFAWCTIYHCTLLFPAGSKSGGGSHAFDIGTKSGLTSLYNERVVSAEKVTRPLDSFGGKSGIPHAGVRVTTESGNQYLVHKGSNFGKSSQTVVVDAKHMSSQWTGHGDQKVAPCNTVAHTMH